MGKPSALIRLALNDLRAAERSKLYKINMNTWHEPNGKCSVCFAGSVMAGSLGVDPQCGNVNPYESDGEPLFDHSDFVVFEALNNFRSGDLISAFNALDREMPRYLADEIDVHPYTSNKNRFKADMEKLANVLEAVGE